MTGELRITLVRGLSGRPERVRRIVKGLGLTRLHRTVTRKNTPEIRGMVEKVKFLLQVENVEESE